MIDKEALRQTALQEADSMGTKRRFGLFSQPISNAIGDDGEYKTKQHPRDESGKPVTKARNFQSGPCRSGQMKKSYFGDLNSLATNKDEYIDPDRKLLQIQNERFKNGPKNENKYKPASKTGSNVLWKSSYPFTEENPPEKDPKRNREEDGRVKTKLRNAYTNPGSKVIDTLFKHEKHIDDPYDRAHVMEIQKMKKDKALEGDPTFRPNSFHGKVFNKDIKIYGQDVELKAKVPKQTKFNIFPHENTWRRSSPNKHGLYGYFTPFPVYMENPPREIKRRNPSEDKKEVFKAMSSTLTTPTSSITCNPMNMRKHTSRSFSSTKY